MYPPSAADKQQQSSPRLPERIFPAFRHKRQLQTLLPILSSDWNVRYFASTAEKITQDLSSEDDQQNLIDSEDDDSSSVGTSKSSQSKKNNQPPKKKKKFKKRKRKLVQKSKQQKSLEEEEIVLRQQLEELFDEVAPLVLPHKLEQYIRILQGKHTQKERQRVADQSSQAAAEEEEQGNNKKNNSKNLKTEIAEEDPKTWMHTKILSFLDILPLHAIPAQTIESPAMRHQKTLSETTEILKRARDKAAGSKVLSWSSLASSPANRDITPEKRQTWHAAKTKAVLKQEAQEFAHVLSDRLPSKKFNSLVRFLDDYVKVVDDDRRKQVSLPIDHDNKKPAKKVKKPKRVKTVGIRILFNNMERKLGGHVHLIAPELAKFFYFDPPDIRDETQSVARKEPKVLESEEKWKKAKQSFVTNMLSLYRKIHHPPPPPPPDEEETDAITESNSVSEEDDEALAELVETTMKESSSSKQKTPADTYTKSTKHHVHLLFDTALADQYREREIDYPMLSNTTVFIDNLPIDITENQVLELYSRCGPIESVEVFNQRPDLDPGILSPAKQMALAKSRRKSRLTQSKGIGGARWARPRTPVYAMLSFANEEATRAASQGPLRIFGMIVNGHSVRSIHAKEMTRLYLDGIPPTGVTGAKGKHQSYRTAMDIEYSLSQLLNPDMYISFDINSSSHKKSKSSVIGSCEIMFPSFEVAYESYDKLQKGLDMLKEDESCRLNWIRTPPDATLYWTRQLGGV